MTDDYNAKREITLEHDKETKGSNRFSTEDDPAITSLYVRKPYMKGVTKIRVTIEEA